jgi:hypothetical protein
MLYDHKMVEPEEQVRSLRDYLKPAPHIVPDDEVMNKPTLRHPDLVAGNVLMSDGETSGIVNWQHCAVLPLFLQSEMAEHFRFLDDADSEKLCEPKLPANFESLSDEDKGNQNELYRRRQLQYF